MKYVKFSDIKVGQVFFYYYRNERPIKCIKCIPDKWHNGYYLDAPMCSDDGCYFMDGDILTLELDS